VVETASNFPKQRPNKLFLTEAGIETELMYKWGFEIPHFAMFALLENDQIVSTLRGMYRSYLDVAAKHEMSFLMGGFDYRASPDWAELLGYGPEALKEANLRCLDFHRQMGAEYASDVPEAVTMGCVGPRGDAYQLNRTISEAEAEDYHSVQLTTLRDAKVPLVYAATFNNIPEAVGVVRAARRLGLPIALSFSLDSNSKLKSGPSVKEAIEAVDEATDRAPEFYAINCSHPVEFEPALEPGSWIERLRNLRPNASKMEKIALCKLGHLEEGDPIELGQLMGQLAKRYPHMDIWGGCCGTGEVHLEEIARNVCAAFRDEGTISPR
jgi:S-methylmethionine-dependent homocysteine/selenocysteine methylase